MIPGVAGVILAGGKSSRFGTNKALALHQGLPLVQGIARRLAPLFAETLLVTNTPEEYAFLGWPMTGDRFPDCGPMAGIQAALAAIRQPAAFICACDMPLVEAALVRHLCARRADYDVVLPWLAGGPEPLYAVYSRKALPRIEESLDQGNFRLNDLCRRLRVLRVGPAEILALLPDFATFHNVNRREDLRACPTPDRKRP
jgi:molybdopterin-guanine dinucleotide biosynthesis protein A